MKATSQAVLWFGVAAVSVFFMSLVSCAAVQAVKNDLGAILATCGDPVVKAEKADVLSIVTDIVEGNSPNWQAQLAAQEAVAKAAVLCALEEIANGGAPAGPTVRTLSASPSRLIGQANARAYLSQHP